MGMGGDEGKEGIMFGLEARLVYLKPEDDNAIRGDACELVIREARFSVTHCGSGLRVG